MDVLVINAGSSSLKYQLFDMKTESILAKGLCDRIGIDGHLKHTPVVGGKAVFDSDVPLPSHTEAINAVIEKLTCKDHGVIESLSEIKAIGHRFVHGGPDFSESVLITDDVLKTLESYAPLAPLHTPPNLTGINACKAVVPAVPQVAVFDTAFHQTMPDYAYTYAIPYKYFEENHIRRYGFHGTSHRFVSDLAIKSLGGNAQGTKIVTCHLGNGASLAAIKDGKVIDTTMGVTPLEGIPMGTRSGSLDPAIVGVIAAIEGGLDTNEATNILNKQSGVLGISGVSSDFRDIEAVSGYDVNTGEPDSSVKVNTRCKLALEVFAYNVAKFIGSYVVALGGLDALAFTAGVGENSPLVRIMVCEHLAGMGVYLDISKNKECARGKAKFMEVSDAKSSAKVYIIPTNEELVIARDTMEIVK